MTQTATALQSAPSRGTTSASNGHARADEDALFAPPTPDEIAARMKAWENFGNSAVQRDTPVDLSAEADPYGYEERVAQIMGGHR